MANYFYKQNKQIYQKAFILQSGTVGTKSFYQTQNNEFAIWWCPTSSTYGAGFWNLDYSENLKNNSPCRGKVISESRTRCPWRTRSNSIDSIPWRYYETCSNETYDAGVSLYTCSSHDLRPKYDTLAHIQNHKMIPYSCHPFGRIPKAQNQK